MIVAEIEEGSLSAQAEETASACLARNDEERSEAVSK